MGILHGLLASLLPGQAEPLAKLRTGSVATARGRVVPRDLIECPLTGERGVYYHYTVEEWRPSQVAALPGDGFWALSETDEAIAEFYLDDGTARAMVAPHRARIERGRRVAPQPVDVGILGRRAHEMLIGGGQLVEVTALVDRIDDLFDEGRGYRASPTRLCLRAPPGESIVIRAVDEPPA